MLCSYVCEGKLSSCDAAVSSAPIYLLLSIIRLLVRCSCKDVPFTCALLSFSALKVTAALAGAEGLFQLHVFAHLSDESSDNQVKSQIRVNVIVCRTKTKRNEKAREKYWNVLSACESTCDLM